VKHEKGPKANALGLWTGRHGNAWLAGGEMRNSEKMIPWLEYTSTAGTELMLMHVNVYLFKYIDIESIGQMRSLDRIY